MKKFFTGLVLLCSLLFLVTPKMYGQGNQATVIGNISEEKTGPIIGATVIVKNESTGFQTGTVTDTKGDYIIKQLPLGSPYSVTVSYLGYGEQKKTGYSLNQGDQLRLNFSLEASATELQAVEIVANSLKNTVETLGASTPITARDIARLPVNGRNFTSLIDL
ncbi:carboxypeptidase-like regulatory domain-containing protein [Dyadobacter sp. LHD-138]|uniref:carboxypeptidase-like regulatory domain-containing protein n=1 Tax=Dyadobacter sp. LHD-138 TaxID=3071413 RepID=UPI0027DF5582|nr:carboxypeptidase-like regulatory domain-containing protein [Dyadobacter sp. LHD-138]MDQ6481912.1 carboxypeptidase-like regulatory domain-containing protein [Dyadobacter sp. LHD-138]